MTITLIGHPFAPIGMGEQVRAAAAALLAAGAEPRVLDLYRAAARTDPAYVALADGRETDAPGATNLWHLNGDEIAPALDRLGGMPPGRNVVVPAWELPRYPAVWVPDLARFDAIWAGSRFLQDSLAAAGLPSVLIGQSVEPDSRPLLPRRYFGLREDAFLVLHFCDLSSYAPRKNPQAVVEVFRRVAALDAARNAARPLTLVLKGKDAAAASPGWAAGLDLAGLDVRVLDAPLDALATRSLVAACDAFASLHRAEGFGRGTAEAMWFGRLALATGWSGTLDHADADTALLVGHTLVPVPPGAYPQSEGQHWAEPDLDHATALLDRALREPEWAAAIAARGCAAIRLRHSHRAIGLRMLAALEHCP